MYGNYGNYGGMYANGFSNGFGNGMYSNFPSFGSNRPFMLNPSNSFSQSLEANTRNTFQMLDQIVQTFTGFAQMLDSTFYATYSSFAAMAGVIDQFQSLRNYLGQILSMLAFYKTVKGKQSRPSLKPLLVFLALVLGLPLLISKISRLMQDRLGSFEDQWNNKPMFVKVVHPYKSSASDELDLEEGEIVAILENYGSTGQDCWYKGRKESGRTGLFPSTFVQTIQK